MESRKFPLLIALVGAIVAVGLFVVLRDDGDDGDGDSGEPVATGSQGSGGSIYNSEPPAGQQGGGQQQKPERPQVPEIVIRGGQPVGGVEEIEVAKGDRIRFVVRSDAAEQVHLHGYDVLKDVGAGDKVAFNIPATLEGGYEIELEGSHTQIAQISVVP